MTNDKSQYSQSNFILEYFDYKTNGFFVDCGILDGIRHSNTYLLEIEYNWRGVLIEASQKFFKEAIRNRSKENVFINKALYRESGKRLLFNEIGWDVAPGLSGLVESYSPEHRERIAREADDEQRIAYNVETITLDDVLDNNCNAGFELLKIDLEGGEFDALRGFDIARWKPKLVCCELSDSNIYLTEIKNYFLRNAYKEINRKGNDIFYVPL